MDRNGPSLADIAGVAADDFLRAAGDGKGPGLRGELVRAIELALLTAVRDERRACAAECTRRAELWEKTADRPDASELIRREAQSRANEAAYLADVLSSRR